MNFIWMLVTASVENDFFTCLFMQWMINRSSGEEDAQVDLFRSIHPGKDDTNGATEPPPPPKEKTSDDKRKTQCHCQRQV